MGLVRVLQWHNSFGRGLPWQADARPSPGLEGCWAGVGAKWLHQIFVKAAPICLGISTAHAQEQWGWADG